ncbi:MAG: hypothetical protein NZO58_05040 [Gemmataceae bacterium]|nr:hypothetical protein [Gemmataceae bacterium]
MEELNKTKEAISNVLPESARGLLDGPGWYILLGVAGVVALLVVLAFFGVLGRLFRREKKVPVQNLEERFAEYPPAKPSTGDRRLTIEGVPVRLRLVVVAAAGSESQFDEEQIDRLLDRILPGLGAVMKGDKPRVKIWPRQLSYEGFTKNFHRNTIIPEGENKLSKWAVVAGRAKLDDCQVMLGLGLEALKPTTIGRKTIDAHEWDVLLRIRTRE